MLNLEELVALANKVSTDDNYSAREQLFLKEILRQEIVRRMSL